MNNFLQDKALYDNSLQENPLLDFSTLPHFGQIEVEHIIPAIEFLLTDNRAKLSLLLAQNQGHYSWDNLLKPLQEMDDRLSRAWSPVSHLNSVKNSEPLRAAHEHCLPLLSEYHTEMGQNTQLYKAIKSIADSEEYDSLSAAQKKIISNNLRDFHLSGIDLDADKKQQYKDIRQQLSKLRSSYENNVLDATNAWSRHIIEPELLAGLPDPAILPL